METGNRVSETVLSPRYVSFLLDDFKDTIAA